MIKIFGDELPKLVFSDLTVDYGELTGHLSVTGKVVFRDFETKVHTSVLTGKRHIVRKGAYASVELTAILPTGSDWAFDEHLADILDHELEAVTVYPNSDSYQAWTGHVLSVKPFYYDDDTDYHAYTLIVQSDEYVAVNLTESLPEHEAYAVADTDRDRLVDQDGNNLVLRFDNTIPNA